MPQEDKPQEVISGWYLKEESKNKPPSILGEFLGFLPIFVLEVVLLGTLVAAWIKWIILGWIFRS